MTPGTRLIGVYESEAKARAAAEVAKRAGAAADAIHIADRDDHVAALEGEMREEMEHTIVGPGNVGPFTKEMNKGMTVAAVAGGAIGVVIALPFAAIDFGGFALWTRLLTVAIVGAICGGTAGWVIGGGFAARRPDEPLAAERGVTLAVPATPGMEAALASTDPIRLDLVEAGGQPITTVTTEDDRTPGGTFEQMRRHAAEEHRHS